MQHNDCDDEEEDGLPQLTMRTLRLDFFEFEDHGWISYFARKYPCLTTLDWQFRLANVITPSHLLERAEDTKNAFMSIPQHCRQLQSLTFKNLEEGFWPGKEFFEGMGGLHTIQLMFSTTIPDRRGMTKEVFDAMLQQNQAALSVLHIPVWLNARVADMLQSIGRCSHLVELELANDDYRSFFSREIDLDMLLGHCKRLKRLTLIRGAVVVGPGYSVQPYPSLTQLALILVRFSPDVFSYLSKRCPNLCDMRIRNCSWISPDPNLTINMPNHAFNTFKIEQVSRLQENGGFHIGYEATIVKLTLLDKIQNIRRRRKMAIEEASLARWYHLHIAENLSRIPLVLGRLQPRQIAELHMYRGMAMPTNLPQRSTPHARRKEWIYDIPYGYIAIRCKSINRFTMDIITLKY
ncbi:hypothetical protein DFQ28_003319 [Apophysomyces sp. BC1034]|nr:hypothetical protein DFQ29_005330 [Apophysomyces sp. BC1021]KAG0189505.1 hypothetical protein DFQ28_003319 [Apophysomyces sp. BC1034]